MDYFAITFHELTKVLPDFWWMGPIMHAPAFGLLGFKGMCHKAFLLVNTMDMLTLLHSLFFSIKGVLLFMRFKPLHLAST
jgi:hypothetical protein